MENFIFCLNNFTSFLITIINITKNSTTNVEIYRKSIVPYLFWIPNSYQRHLFASTHFNSFFSRKSVIYKNILVHFLDDFYQKSNLKVHLIILIYLKMISEIDRVNFIAWMWKSFWNFVNSQNNLFLQFSLPYHL